MRRIVLWLILVLVALVLHFPAGADVTKNRSVVGTGGSVSKGDYVALCTTGQPVTGIAGSASGTALIGFWYGKEWASSGLADEIDTHVPEHFQMGPACPNPFRSATALRFNVPRRSRVKIAVYDVTGREVVTLVDGEVDPGNHEVLLHSGKLAGGIYFCRMVAAGYVKAQKLVLLN